MKMLSVNATIPEVEYHIGGAQQEDLDLPGAILILCQEIQALKTKVERLEKAEK